LSDRLSAVSVLGFPVRSTPRSSTAPPSHPNIVHHDGYSQNAKLEVSKHESTNQRVMSQQLRPLLLAQSVSTSDECCIKDALRMVALKRSALCLMLAVNIQISEPQQLETSERNITASVTDQVSTGSDTDHTSAGVCECKDVSGC